MINGTFIKSRVVAFTLLAVGLFSHQACADTSVVAAPYALQQALATDQHMSLYTPKSSGFELDSAYFSGSANGVTTPSTSNVTDFDDDQRLYALLVDGRYDFNHDNAAVASPVHPYLMGGMGLATTLRGPGYNNFDAQSGSVVPLLRMGGGMSYQLDQQWNLSVDYKTGLAASSTGNYLFTGRNQQSVDLQSINLGMHFTF